jgi:hypothetical protein
MTVCFLAVPSIFQACPVTILFTFIPSLFNMGHSANSFYGSHDSVSVGERVVECYYIDSPPSGGVGSMDVHYHSQCSVFFLNVHSGMTIDHSFATVNRLHLAKMT